ncbi:DUF5709 domain-containing protein [Kitasatospora sp. NBC_00085]|uniref:DUF5709 domain-containing protein n=1 Tax=unclassified Kitasatospora TaxID=2633591 RepID=UPI0032539261
MAATPEGAKGDEVYQPDGEQREDSGVLDPEDTLIDRGADPYEEGWSPVERPLAVDRTGTTPAEQRAGETLDQRLAEEVPDPALEVVGDPADGGAADEPVGADREVGDERAGRLVEPPGRGPDGFAVDVGVDGAAASAEEAAVHVIPEDPVDPDGARADRS